MKSLYVAMGVFLCLNVAVAMVGLDSIIQGFGSVTGRGGRFGPSVVQTSLLTGTTKQLSLDDAETHAKPRVASTLEPFLPDDSPDINGDEIIASAEKGEADADTKDEHMLKQNRDASRMEDESSESHAENTGNGETEQQKENMRPSGKVAVPTENPENHSPVARFRCNNSFLLSSETWEFNCEVEGLVREDEIRAMEVDDLVAYAIHMTNTSKHILDVLVSNYAKHNNQKMELFSQLKKERQWTWLIVAIAVGSLVCVVEKAAA